jgi:hypothetical protein
MEEVTGFIAGLQSDDETELLKLCRRCVNSWRNRQDVTELASSLVTLDTALKRSPPSHTSLLQRLLELADGNPSLDVRDAALEALAELPVMETIMKRLEQCAAFQPYLQKVRWYHWTCGPSCTRYSPLPHSRHHSPHARLRSLNHTHCAYPPPSPHPAPACAAARRSLQRCCQTHPRARCGSSWACCASAPSWSQPDACASAALVCGWPPGPWRSCACAAAHSQSWSSAPCC